MLRLDKCTLFISASPLSVILRFHMCKLTNHIFPNHLTNWFQSQHFQALDCFFFSFEVTHFCIYVSFQSTQCTAGALYGLVYVSVTNQSPIKTAERIFLFHFAISCHCKCFHFIRTTTVASLSYWTFTLFTTWSISQDCSDPKILVTLQWGHPRRWQQIQTSFAALLP